ncbi:MAG: tRNA (adenosine(37)-N6)-threonylcarbamoyltransferase complex dimerization subunit type 1 TsaB, partial [Bacteroidia bacterium]|nr:tRNA (adenosine(37)-N6)-threonylcarbamoyltransferase complex dimerization subunit type 1 TsaB [Bacteroidia bacterium]
MINILCIETATSVCSVALSQDGQCTFMLEHPDGNAHAAELHVMIKNILEQANIQLEDLQAVALSKGPGSYTGLRVGTAAAKGLCYALSIPLLAINTLESLTKMALKKISQTPENALFIPMIDARRMEVYSAIFSSQGAEVKPTEAVIIEPDSFSEFLENTPCLFFGNGSDKCEPILKHPNAQFIPNITCSAEGLTQLAFQYYNNQNFE